MTTATTAGREVTYLEAISQALDEEMARDERVFLMGEDIGPYGGAFRITEGFQQKYGEWRVLDTPLSESGFVGAAIGAAMMGMRPVVEMQFADFISCAFDQITEVAAKNHYRWGAPVPLVIRAPFGGGVHGGPFHSECPEGWFFHSPGLKLVAPSTPYQEANKTGVTGAEVAALLPKECFDSLDGPIMRIAAPDTPVPFSTPLEEFFLPKVSDIVAAAKKLAAY